MPRQQTIRINHGYQIDSKWEAFALAGRGLRRTFRTAWQYRTELGLVAAVLLPWLVSRQLMPELAALAVTLVTIAGVALWPGSRALVVGRLGCARTRRRLLACMRETRVATSAGRLPLVLRARATPAGEQLTFGLFPGQSTEQLEARVEELRAAARARDVTVTRDPSRADRVTVDVVRRDLLHPSLVLASPLVGLAAAFMPAAHHSPTASPTEEVSP